MDETILGVIPHVLQSTGGISSKQFTIIVTNQRLIIAQFTRQLMEEALTQARTNTESKGFLGGLLAGRVLTSQDLVKYSEKYYSMFPEKIIGESPSNFSLDIPSISMVKVEYTRKKSASDEHFTISQYTLTIESGYGVYSYIFDADPQDMDVLRRGLGNKVTGSGRSSPIKPLSSRKEINPPKNANRFCSYCGAQLPINAKFCSHCGKALM